jgi:isopentenyl phosphate kinase
MTHTPSPHLPASPAPRHQAPLYFLKLGGSLITDKLQPRTPRPETLARLMGEIAAALNARPGLHLVLGHGSGSFGHAEARQYGTRQGVHTAEEWLGFASVQAAAGALNQMTLKAARAAGLPVANFPPSASAVCRDGAIQSLAVEPIERALESSLVPVVFGDVAVDQAWGGTIVSTEDVFGYLAPRLRPKRVLLAGIEPGVRTRWPDGEVFSVITPQTPLSGVAGSHAADVTGGMASKVQEMLKLVEAQPALEVLIFSGEVPGRLRAALRGQPVTGTLIRSA